MATRQPDPEPFVEHYDAGEDELTSDQIAWQEFEVTLRGYAREEVRSFLHLVASMLDDRDARIAQLESEPQPRSEPQPQLDREYLLNTLGQEIGRTLVDAETTSAKMRSEAQAEAERIVSSAERECENLRAIAQREAEDIIGNAKREAEDLLRRASMEENEKRTKVERLLNNLGTAKELLLELVAEVEQNRDEVVGSEHEIPATSRRSQTKARQPS